MNYSELSNNELVQILEKSTTLSDKDLDFAFSLISGFKRYGRISDKQRYWLVTLAERSDNPQKAPERVKTAIGDLAALNALFDKAAQNLKHPSFIFDVDGVGIKVSVAGPTSKAPGTLNVTTQGSFENRTWFGRILKDGQFEASPRANIPSALVDGLKNFAKDPAGQAALYGQKFGICCFCSRELTDGRSIHVGYGPICAEKWNLPWGEKEKEAA